MRLADNFELVLFMEQASGRIMTGIRRAFFAHLPLTSLLLWLSTALRFFFYFQVNTGGWYAFWIMLQTSTMMVVFSAPFNPSPVYLT